MRESSLKTPQIVLEHRLSVPLHKYGYKFCLCFIFVLFVFFVVVNEHLLYNHEEHEEHEGKQKHVFACMNLYTQPQLVYSKTGQRHR
jgi:hypothetical protein